MQDTTRTGIDSTVTSSLDPWRIVVAFASRNLHGLLQGLKWLCLFAKSGVEIPLSIYMKFSSLANEFSISVPDSLLLVEAALISSWLKSLGRQQLQTLFSDLHSRLGPDIIGRLRSRKDLSEV